MRAYYNENDPYAARWLRNLIDARLIPGGHVDDRSIEEVRSPDLAGFKQAHFFAGIAGWSHALQLARWPDDREVWTGSCPCQPFSQAGKRRGVSDERHLWPVWRELIRERMPATIFGEQVASKDGRAWLARVRADLEAMGYAVGAADLCAASVGSPHIRQRLWWVADLQGNGRQEECADERGIAEGDRTKGRAAGLVSGRDGDRLADTENADRGSAADTQDTGRRAPEARGCSGDGGRGSRQDLPETSGTGCDGRLGNAECNGREQGTKEVCRRESEPAEPGEDGGLGHAERSGLEGCGTGVRGGPGHGAGGEQASPTGFWDDSELVPCLDGKARRVGTGIQPLAHGVPCRVGKLRAYGNAIVPQVAAEFIAAYLEG